jgi:hypothetical protein
MRDQGQTCQHQIYEESSDNVIKLLSKDFEDIRRYPGMKNPVATTWLISFEQIHVRDPLAADLMVKLSNRSGILQPAVVSILAAFK